MKYMFEFHSSHIKDVKGEYVTPERLSVVVGKSHPLKTPPFFFHLVVHISRHGHNVLTRPHVSLGTVDKSDAAAVSEVL
jgi:hypothetical protein